MGHWACQMAVPSPLLVMWPVRANAFRTPRWLQVGYSISRCYGGVVSRNGLGVDESQGLQPLCQLPKATAPQKPQISRNHQGNERPERLVFCPSRDTCWKDKQHRRSLEAHLVPDCSTTLMPLQDLYLALPWCFSVSECIDDNNTKAPD